MKTKIVFASATALGLLMTAGAFADNNKATVKQNGNNNAAIGQQSGTNNWIGLPNASSTYGHVEQNGDNNNLYVQQTGNNNYAGYSYGDAGIHQNGDQNSFELTQATGGNYTANGAQTIQQTSSDGSVTTNKLVIKQDASAASPTSGQSQQIVGHVTQTNTLANVTNAADANAIDILQEGTGYGKGNQLGSTTQNGYNNTQDIDQLGTSNYIYTVTQTGSRHGATIYLNGDQNALYKLEQTGGNGDTATVRLSGLQNGTGSAGFIKPNGSSPFTVYANGGPNVMMGVFTGAGPAAGVANVTQGEVHQVGGSGNTVSYVAVGNYNLYGLTQNGNGNSAWGTVTGDSNEMAIWQHGDGDVTDFVQDGSGNNFGASSDGSNNLLNLRQAGDNNKLTASIQGDKNNNYSLTGNALNGDALTAKAAILGAANGAGFGQGDLWQNGNLNTMTVTVTASSSNAFGMFQGGDGNTLTHNISGGDGNQAVIAQLGNNNNSVTIQIGSNNNVGIIQ